MLVRNLWRTRTRWESLERLMGLSQCLCLSLYGDVWMWAERHVFCSLNDLPPGLWRRPDLTSFLTAQSVFAGEKWVLRYCCVQYSAMLIPSVINVVCMACSIRVTTNLFLIPFSHLLGKGETFSLTSNLSSSPPSLTMSIGLTFCSCGSLHICLQHVAGLWKAMAWSLCGVFCIYFLSVMPIANFLHSQAGGWCVQWLGLHT